MLNDNPSTTDRDVALNTDLYYFFLDTVLPIGIVFLSCSRRLNLTFQMQGSHASLKVLEST